jgi:hypothetical protein
MILGIGLAAFGYSIFYWGIHHFPGWDCRTKDGCRYSLLELLGVPKSWGPMTGQVNGMYPSVGLTAGQQAQAGDTGQQTQQQNPENQTTPSALGPNNTGYINSILTGLTAPTSFNNQNKLVAWNNCEGNLAGHSGAGINNPFNTTLDCCGGTSVNSAGVKSYPTMTAGVQAILQTLQAKRYAAVVSNLQNDGDFKAFANAVGSSGWGTSGSCIASHGS